MSADAVTPVISYEEKQTLGFLERLLLDSQRSDTGTATGAGARVARLVAYCCAGIAISLALFHLFVAFYGTPEGRSFRSVHLTGMLVLAFFMNPLYRHSWRDPVLLPGDSAVSGNRLRQFGFGIDLLLIALVLFVQVWTLYDLSLIHI